MGWARHSVGWAGTAFSVGRRRAVGRALERARLVFSLSLSIDSGIDVSQGLFYEILHRTGTEEAVDCGLISETGGWVNRGGFRTRNVHGIDVEPIKGRPGVYCVDRRLLEHAMGQDLRMSAVGAGDYLNGGPVGGDVDNAYKFRRACKTLSNDP